MQKYRLEIDGLRGISVILVVLYHAKINFFSGGFFGVDIFFVISGFLITNIIINLIQKNQFSLIKFYERRIRRIIPALYILLLFLVIYSYLIQSPYFSRDLSQSIFFTPIFLQNILNIFEGANYFNLSYDLKPLGHTWSLSIEEQFYLIFPLVIFIFFKSSKQFLYNLIIFLFLSSLFLYFYLGLSERYIGYHFFLTLSRVWEILFGCILAFKKFNFKKKSFLPLIGLTIIVLSVIIQNYISLALILRVFVVVGTGIIIISSFQNQENLVNKILKSKILVFFGLISYSLYLWHMPIFSIYRDFFSFKTNIIENIYLIFITMLISFISFKYIETPFRNIKIVSSKNIYTVFFIGIFFFPLYGYYGHVSNGFEKSKILKLNEDKKNYYVSFIKEKEKVDKFKLKQIYKNKNIVVIGDSLATDTVNSLNTQNIKAIRYDLNGPCFEKLLQKGYACNKSLKNILSVTSKAKKVIIASDFGNESSELGAINLYNFLKQNNIKSKIIGGLNFSYVSSSSYRYAKYNIYNNQSIEEFYFNNIQPNIFEGNKILKDSVGNDYIDKFEFICNFKSKICKMFTPTNKPIFYDTKHLTVEGYFKFGEYLKDKI